MPVGHHLGRVDTIADDDCDGIYDDNDCGALNRWWRWCCALRNPIRVYFARIVRFIYVMWRHWKLGVDFQRASIFAFCVSFCEHHLACVVVQSETETTFSSQTWDFWAQSELAPMYIVYCAPLGSLALARFGDDVCFFARHPPSEPHSMQHTYIVYTHTLLFQRAYVYTHWPTSVSFYPFQYWFK